MNTIPWLLIILYGWMLPTSKKATLEYDVLARGEVIGHISITKTTAGQKSIYHSLNESEVQVLKKIKLHHELTAVFRNGILERSEVIVHLNGNLHTHTRVVKDNGMGYKVFRENQQTDQFDKPITFTAIKLYFEEPRSVPEVFSEQFALWNPIIPSTEAEYDYILDKKGKPNYYRYENGKLVFAHIGTRLMATQIQLVES